MPWKLDLGAGTGTGAGAGSRGVAQAGDILKIAHLSGSSALKVGAWTRPADR